MTTKELIERLKKYPENTLVKVSATYDCGFGLAGGEVQYIEEYDYNNTIVLCSEEE